MVGCFRCGEHRRHEPADDSEHGQRPGVLQDGKRSARNGEDQQEAKRSSRRQQIEQGERCVGSKVEHRDAATLKTERVDPATFPQSPAHDKQPEPERRHAHKPKLDGKIEELSVDGFANEERQTQQGEHDADPDGHVAGREPPSHGIGNPIRGGRYPVRRPGIAPRSGSRRRCAFFGWRARRVRRWTRRRRLWRPRLLWVHADRFGNLRLRRRSRVPDLLGRSPAGFQSFHAVAQTLDPSDQETSQGTQDDFGNAPQHVAGNRTDKDQKDHHANSP